MNNFTETSVREIISKVYADLDIQNERRFLSYIEWMAEALYQIGSSYLFHTKTTELTVKDFKAEVPCNLESIEAVIRDTVSLQYDSSLFDTLTTNKTGQDYNLFFRSSFSYGFDNPHLILPFKDGTIKIIYKTIKLDEEGFPVIPDIVSVKEALYRYIVYKEFYPKFLTGEINIQVYSKLEQDWHFYCGQARGRLNTPTLDQLESFKNQTLKLIPQLHSHFNQYNFLNNRDNLSRNIF